MSNPNKRKGTQWERDLQDYLRSYMGVCERSAATGRDDEGDLWFTFGGKYWVVEAKNEQTIRLAAYMQEKDVEANNWRKSRPNLPMPQSIAAVKRRGKGVEDGYVVMTVKDFVRMVKDR